MGNKRSAVGEDRVAALMRAGGTADSITATLRAEGVPASRSTVHRRMQELSGRVKSGRAKDMRASPPRMPRDAPALPVSPDAIPEGADLATLDRWLETAERMGKLAEEDGDLSALASAGRLSASLLEAKRKATPVPRPDPNDSPDMIKLGGEVEKRFHRMVEQVGA